MRHCHAPHGEDAAPALGGSLEGAPPAAGREALAVGLRSHRKGMEEDQKGEGEMSGYGEPEDVSGECNAHLYIGDNFGDNHATIRCQLKPGHDGEHVERFKRDEGNVEIRWELDERHSRRQREGKG